MLTEEQKKIDGFYQTLINPQQPIGLRYQAVFELKNINTPAAIGKIIQAYPFLKESVLLSHQILYTLGQLDESKINQLREFLIAVVENQQQNNLSRHESAEALANYFLAQLPQLYKKHLASTCNQLRWTCQIALQKVNHPELKERYGLLYYNTKEPAAPFNEQQFNEFIKNQGLQQVFATQGYLGVLLKENIPLFAKYRIMYYMRNINTQAVKLALCKLLSLQFYKTQTSLLKHQVCFILGQIGCEGGQYLVRECIENTLQEPIVRHQALAAVASQSKDAAYLDKFINHPDILIRESAQVAQFQIKYWND